MTNELMSSLPAMPTPFELGSMSTQHLRGELARALTLSAQTLAYLATIWRELEKRGEDLSDLRVGLAAYLPLIAAGQLDANVVVRFAGQPTLLRTLSSMPLDEQRRLAAGDPIEILTVNERGEYVAVRLPATAITASQARVAFEPGRVRSIDEQRAMLEAAKLAAARRARPGPSAHVRYDPRADRIRVGSTSATVGEVAAALAEASGYKPAEAKDLESPLVVKLTEAEHKGVKIRAAQAGMTLQDYARALLVMQSVL